METSTVRDDKIVTTHIDTDAKKALDSALTVKEKLLIALQTWATQRGTNEIYQTIDDLAAFAKVHRPTAQTTLYIMAQNNEIEILKSDRIGSAAPKIIGFKLKKAASPQKIVAKSVEQVKHDETKPTVKKLMSPKILPHLIHVRKYMDQKMAVDQARKILVDAGVDASVSFETDPLAEEAVQILEELVVVTRLLGECKIEQEAARRTQS